MKKSLIFKPQNTSLTKVIVATSELEEIQQQLKEKLKNAPQDFFSGVGFVLDCQYIDSVSVDWLYKLKQIFFNEHLLLIGLMNHQFSSADLESLQMINIEENNVRAPQNSRERSQVSEQHETATEFVIEPLLPKETNRTLIIRQPVRSGQRIYAQSSDLTIFGTVGAGAEIIADGNINVIGSLRGRAFAGAKGDIDAYIFCNHFSAELISIAGNYQNVEQYERYKNQNNILVTLNKDETMQIVSV